MWRFARYFLFSLFLIAPSAFSAKPAEGFHICYFSLNNEKEFQEAQKFTAKLNKVSPRKITVSEHLTEKGDPTEAFQALVDSGQRCDGLVISGHHTGSFSGTRAEGNLGIDFLEKLSCDPKKAAWFRNVNALWLQGCRTLGVGQIAPDQSEIDLFSADFHTGRVGGDAERRDHGVGQSLEQLNREFSSTLDQDNPLSSRYLRLFPQAKVFGWTKTAPGVKAKSEYSIPYHMAHIVGLMKKELPGDPIAAQLSARDAASYALAITLALSPLDARYQHCEDLTVEAWKKHGQVFGPTRYSFDNPDLQAFPKLYTSKDSLLLDVRKKECKLRLAESNEEVSAAVKDLLRDERHLPYALNSILARIQREKELGNEETLAAIHAELRRDGRVLAFLKKKVESPQTGLLSRLDFYAFHREFSGERMPEVEKRLFETALAQINRPVKEDDYDAQDFKMTLSLSLVGHELFDYSRFREVKDPGTIARMAWKLGEYPDAMPPGFAADLYDFVVKSEFATEDMIKNLARLEGVGKSRAEVFHELLSHSKAGAFVSAAILGELAKAREAGALSGADEGKLFERIVKGAPLRDKAWAELLQAIFLSRAELPARAEWLRSTLWAEKGNSLSLRRFYKTLEDAPEMASSQMISDLWTESTKFSGFDADALLVMAVDSSRFAGSVNVAPLWEAMLESPRFERDLAPILRHAVKKSPQSDEKKEAFLRKLDAKVRALPR